MNFFPHALARPPAKDGELRRLTSNGVVGGNRCRNSGDVVTGLVERTESEDGDGHGRENRK